MNPIHYRNVPQQYNPDADESLSDEEIPQQLNQPAKTIEPEPMQIPRSQPVDITKPEKRIESPYSNEWNICFFGD